MQKLEKQLSKRTDKPVFEVKIDNQKIRCLLDTGSDISVYTLGAENLLRRFANAQKVTDLYANIHGFGDGSNKAEIYNIKNFVIKSDDTDDYITFQDFYVACLKKVNIKHELIIGAPVLSKIKYTIDKLNNKLILECSKKVYSTACSRKVDDMTKVYKLYSFTQ